MGGTCPSTSFTEFYKRMIFLVPLQSKKKKVIFTLIYL